MQRTNPKPDMSQTVLLLSLDLDGTLLGTPEACARFMIEWQAIPRLFRPLLVYNTSRTTADTLSLIAQRRLPSSDYIVGSLGTELHAASASLSEEFRARLEAQWNPQRVEAIVASWPGMRRQSQEFLHRYKSSWFWEHARPDELERLRRTLNSGGMTAHVDYSCRHFLDVVPGYAGKGNALAWLCARLEISLNHVLVAGDTGNDISMFQLPQVRGIIVANALPELREACSGRLAYCSRLEMADGVIDGLKHFGLLPLPPGPAIIQSLRAAPAHSTGSTS